MANFDDHPTVKWWREQATDNRSTSTATLNSDSLRKLCLEAGADDVGFVEIDRSAIADQRSEILTTFSPTKTLISFVCCMNRENIRTPARSIANLEFHANYDHANEVARNLVKALQQIGVRALNPSAAFPMEMDRFPGKVWIVSHKPVAVAAGLGHMGIHINSRISLWIATAISTKSVREIECNLPLHIHWLGVPSCNGDNSE